MIGCGLAFICTPAILSLIGDSIPRAADAGVDLRVLAFVTSVSFAAALIFGIIPAVTASKTNLVSTLQAGERTVISDGAWLRSSLVIGQVAIGLILAAGAGLLVTSFLNSLHASKGFNPNHLLTFNFDLPDTRYQQTRPNFYRQYFDQVRALPGVQSAAGGMFLPMTNNSANLSFEDPGTSHRNRSTVQRQSGYRVAAILPHPADSVASGSRLFRSRRHKVAASDDCEPGVRGQVSSRGKRFRKNPQTGRW